MFDCIGSAANNSVLAFISVCVVCVSVLSQQLFVDFDVLHWTFEVGKGLCRLGGGEPFSFFFLNGGGIPFLAVTHNHGRLERLYFNP